MTDEKFIEFIKELNFEIKNNRSLDKEEVLSHMATDAAGDEEYYSFKRYIKKVCNYDHVPYDDISEDIKDYENVNKVEFIKAWIKMLNFHYFLDMKHKAIALIKE